MAYEFKFPDVGEGIHEGEIVKWKVKVGDKVEADQPLVEIETDKAVVDIPSPKAGTILKINHKEGETINVGEVLVVIGEEGEKAEGKKEQKVPYTGSVVGFLEEAPEEGEKAEKRVSIKKEAAKRVMATPAVRILAAKLNIDINSVVGTGPEGRITEEDIKKASGTEEKEEKTGIKIARKYDMWGYIDRMPLKGVRKTVSARMYEAHATVVPITNFYDADVTELSELREKEKKAAEKKGVHLTFLPYIIKAVIKALGKHPIINSSLEGEEIIIKKYYNIGVAVDTPDGLIAPVVKGADKKDIFELAKEISILAEKARDRKLDLMDLKGGSFSITNLGSVGVKYFTPMVNYPESCILGPGRIEDKAVAREGKVAVRKILPIVITYDHRIIDGAEAARFMNDLISYLENPEMIFDGEKSQ
ncbi:2-oxo acid dehydrogenase subunit E2 [Candidatus Woesearchaeota archaeon]|nr:2-oxo acid dehydrogenase subunit E2 [Candidatus Woesearchaeota archaeon]